MLAILIAFILAVGALVVFANWRATIPLLLGADLLRILLIRQTAIAASAGRTTLIIVELLTASAVALVLLVTAFTFTREYDAEHLDEFAQMELRRAARETRRQGSQAAERWRGWVVPFGVVLLAGLATTLLTRAYPIARAPMLDTAWMFALLCGLLVLITASDVLKLGIGLLLILSSAKLLYFGVTTQFSVLHIALLELLSLLLAVLAAFLSGLLYARLQTLETAGLFDRT